MAFVWKLPVLVFYCIQTLDYDRRESYNHINNDSFCFCFFVFSFSFWKFSSRRGSLYLDFSPSPVVQVSFFKKENSPAFIVSMLIGKWAWSDFFNFFFNFFQILVWQDLFLISKLSTPLWKILYISYIKMCKDFKSSNKIEVYQIILELCIQKYFDWFDP